MLNVLVVDDERNIRKAFIADIAARPEKYRLVDAVSEAGSAEMYCAAGKADLIIMDINTANFDNGIDATARIKRRYPGVKVIVTTSYNDPYAMDHARQAGADSFWYKDASDVELLEVMDITAAGGSWYPENRPDVPLGLARLSELTAAQMEVLYLLPQYFSNAAIAQKLHIAEGTVKTHIRDILTKTGCHSRAQLIALAIRSKLVIPSSETEEE